jgi:hypothetical protein
VRELPQSARRAARFVRNVAVAAAISAAVVAAFLFRDGLPGDAGGWIARLVAVALVTWPAVVLAVLAGAIRALADLPERLRSTPGDARDRAGELRDLAGRIRSAGPGRLPFLLWRFAWRAASARELLAPHAAVLPLVSLPFLALATAAVPAAFLVIALAIAAAVSLAG